MSEYDFKAFTNKTRNLQEELRKHRLILSSYNNRSSSNFSTTRILRSKVDSASNLADPLSMAESFRNRPLKNNNNYKNEQEEEESLLKSRYNNNNNNDINQSKRYSHNYRASIERLRPTLACNRRTSYRQEISQNEIETLLKENINLKLKLENVELETNRENKMKQIEYEYKIKQIQKEKERLEEEMNGQKTFEKKLVKKYEDLENQYKELQNKYSEAKERTNFMDSKLTEFEYESKRLSTENQELMAMNENLKHQNVELMDFTLSNENPSFVKKEKFSNPYRRESTENRSYKKSTRGSFKKMEGEGGDDRQRVLIESVRVINELVTTSDISRNIKFQLSNIADNINNIDLSNRGMVEERVDRLALNIENNVDSLYTLIKEKIDFRMRSFNEIEEKIDQLNFFKIELKEVLNDIPLKQKSVEMNRSCKPADMNDNFNPEIARLLLRVNNIVFEENIDLPEEKHYSKFILKISKKLEKALLKVNSTPSKNRSDKTDYIAKFKMNCTSIDFSEISRNKSFNKRTDDQGNMNDLIDQVSFKDILKNFTNNSSKKLKQNETGVQKNAFEFMASIALQCDIEEERINQLLEENKLFGNRIKDLQKEKEDLLNKLKPTEEEKEALVNKLKLLEEEKEDLLNKLKLLEEENKMVLDNFKPVEEENNKLLNQIKTLQEEIENVRIELNTSEEEKSYLVEENKVVRKQMNEYKNQIDQSKTEQTDKAKEIEEYKETTNQLKEENSLLTTNNKNKDNIINTLKEEIKNNENNIEDFRNQIEKQFKEAKSSKLQIEEMEKEKELMDSLKKEMELFTKEYQSNIDAYQTKLRNLNDENEFLIEKVKELESATGRPEMEISEIHKIDNFQNSQDDNKVKVNPRNNEITVNGDTIAFQGSHLSTISVKLSRSEIKPNLRKSNSEQFSEPNNNQRNVEDENEFEMEIQVFIKELLEGHKEKVDELQGIIKGLRSDVRKCQNALNDYKIEYQKVKIENHKLGIVRNDNNLLIDKIDEKDKEIIELKKKLEDIEVLNVMNKNKEKNNGSFLKVDEALESEKMNEMENKNLELLEENIEMSDQITFLESKKDELEEERENLLEEIKSLKAKFKEADKKKDSGDKEEVVDNKEIESLKGEIADFQKTNKQLQDNLVEMTCEKKNLENQIFDLTKKQLINQSTKKECNHGDMIRDMKEKITSLNNRVEHKNSQIKDQEEEIENLQSILSNFNEERNGYLDKIERISAIKQKIDKDEEDDSNMDNDIIRFLLRNEVERLSSLNESVISNHNNYSMNRELHNLSSHEQ